MGFHLKMAVYSITNKLKPTGKFRQFSQLYLSDLIAVVVDSYLQ